MDIDGTNSSNTTTQQFGSTIARVQNKPTKQQQVARSRNWKQFVTKGTVAGIQSLISSQSELLTATERHYLVQAVKALERLEQLHKVANKKLGILTREERKLATIKARELKLKAIARGM